MSENQNGSHSQGMEKYFFRASSAYFNKIQGKPIVYWLGSHAVKLFEGTSLSDFSTIKQGLTTSDNDRFLRLWHEVPFGKIGFNFTSPEQASESLKKWFPHNKGGDFRKWYGNLEFLVNYQNDGKEMKDFQSKLNQGWTARIKSREYYFKECLSWTMVTSGRFGVRYYPAGTISNIAGPSIFDCKHRDFILGYLNSKISQKLLNALNPTLNNNVAELNIIPVSYFDSNRIPCLVILRI